MAQDEHEDFSLTYFDIPSSILASRDVMDHVFQGGDDKFFLEKDGRKFCLEMATMNRSN